MDQELLNRQNEITGLFKANQEYFQKCAMIIVAAGAREDVIKTQLTEAGIDFADTTEVFNSESFSVSLPRVHLHVVEDTFKFEYLGPSQRGYRPAGVTDLSWMPYCPTLPAYVSMVYRQLYACEDDGSEARAFRVLRDRSGDLVTHSTLDATSNYHALPEIARIKANDDLPSEPA